MAKKQYNHNAKFSIGDRVEIAYLTTHAHKPPVRRHTGRYGHIVGTFKLSLIVDFGVAGGFYSRDQKIFVSQLIVHPRELIKVNDHNIIIDHNM